MENNHIQDILVESAENKIKEEIKHNITSFLMPDDRKSIALCENKQDIDFEATEEVKKIIYLFHQQFSIEDRQLLGLPTFFFEKGIWFLPWDKGSYFIDLEPNRKLEDVKLLLPDHTDAVQISLRELKAYLTDKIKRRPDESLFAKPYKTLLAKLTHKCIERFELLKDSLLQKQYYLKLLEFLETIWNDDSLISPELREDPSQIHIAHFLYVEMNLCESRLCKLSFDHTPHELANWIDTLDKNLAAIHLVSTRLFHLLLQGEIIPDNLEQQLSKLGNTYHRLSLSQSEIKSDGESLHLTLEAEQFRTLQAFSKEAREKYLKLKKSTNSKLFDVRLEEIWPLVKKNQLKLKEAIFLNINNVLTAEQCIFLALYEPESLPLSTSERADLFGSQTFLKLYLTDPPITGFQWLLWHLQQISDRLVPALSVLQNYKGEETDENFQVKLNNLISKLHFFRQEPLSSAEISNFGILPHLAKVITHQVHIIPSLEKHIILIQKNLRNLILIRALLTQYRTILPLLGEIVGTIALRSDLILLAQQISRDLIDIQEQLIELIPLLNRGYLISINEQQQPTLIRKSSLLELIHSTSVHKKPTVLVTWSKQTTPRRKALTELNFLIEGNLIHLRQLPAKLCPIRLEHLQKTVTRQFQIARIVLLIGFKDKLTKEQQIYLEHGTKIISNWQNLVKLGIEEIKEKESQKQKGQHPKSKQSVKNQWPNTSEFSIFNEYKKPATSDKIRIKNPKASSLSYPATLQSQTLDGVNQLINEITLSAFQLLNKEDDIFNSWNLLLESKQNILFSGWLKKYTSENKSDWTQYLLQHTGIFFTPLPPTSRPKRFIWWYQNTLKDQKLLLQALCFNELAKIIQTQSLNLTPLQKYSWQKLMACIQFEAKQEFDSRWKIFDLLKRNLKLKYQQWYIQITSHKMTYESENQQFTLNSQEPSSSFQTNQEKELPTSVESKEDKVKEKTSIESNNFLTETSVIVTKPKESETKLFPLDIKKDSPDWQKYKKALFESNLTKKELLCLTFFKTAYARIKTGKLSLTTNPQCQQCFEVIHLFWQVFQTSSLSCHWLTIPINQLEKVFTEELSQPITKQKFFIWWTKDILKKTEEKNPSYFDINLNI